MVSHSDKVEIEQSGPEVSESEVAVEVGGDLARSFEIFPTRLCRGPNFPMVRENAPRAGLSAKGAFQ
ncbi:MAG: hypothetical protein DMG49_26020 [Acidobacteria bacterium]|nr:MAG: hypothetical protein DMG49_26020 [Acidobacteriota bacterium]